MATYWKCIVLCIFMFIIMTVVILISINFNRNWKKMPKVEGIASVNIDRYVCEKSCLVDFKPAAIVIVNCVNLVKLSIKYSSLSIDLLHKWLLIE